MLTDNATVKSQSHQILSSKSSSSGTVTPTSDYIDDSGVSEDNASSVNSGSEHGNDNNNYIHNNQSTPASSIIGDIIISPGGSTVVEYKTTQDKIPSPANINSCSTNNGNINSVIASTTTSTTTNNNNNDNKDNNNSEYNNEAKIISANQSNTPHTHFHKKYIKAMNALNGIENSTQIITTSTAPQPTSISSLSNSGAQISIQSAMAVNSTSTIYTIPMKQQYTR